MESYGVTPLDANPRPIREKPNVLITGATGAGKSSFCGNLMSKLGDEYHLRDVQQIAQSNKSGRKIADYMNPMMELGGNIVDTDIADVWPDTWFDLVIVLKCDDPDRLRRRGYTKAANLLDLAKEAGLPSGRRLVLVSARGHWPSQLIVELTHDTSQDRRQHVATCVAWIEEYKKRIAEQQTMMDATEFFKTMAPAIGDEEEIDDQMAGMSVNTQIAVKGAKGGASPSGLTPKQGTEVTSMKAEFSWKGSFKKYFMEGQQLEDDKEKVDPNAPWYVRHRRLINIFIPIIIVWGVWFPYIASGSFEPGPNGHSFTIFTDTEDTGSEFMKPRWYLSVCMIFGSMIAGSTSEGGGAVAFPVMTLALGTKPSPARDVSFLIQGTGMSGASFVIVRMGIKIEWHSIIYCSIGGILGSMFGLSVVTPHLPPAYNKMYFVVIWSTFAVALYMLNRLHGRKTYPAIPDWEGGVVWQSKQFEWLALNWKAVTLLAFGFLGGIFSGLAGSGLDICSFSCLTLLFRVSEKTATPTSVVLMALNSVLSVTYRQFAMEGISAHAWGFYLVTTPIVICGAPFGAFVGSHFHRLTLAGMIYVIDAAQLIGALYAIKPWCKKAPTNDCKVESPAPLCWSSVGILVGGMIFWRLLSSWGMRLMTMIEEAEEAKRNGGGTEMAKTAGGTGQAGASPHAVDL